MKASTPEASVALLACHLMSGTLLALSKQAIEQTVL